MHEVYSDIYFLYNINCTTLALYNVFLIYVYTCNHYSFAPIILLYYILCNAFSFVDCIKGFFDNKTITLKCTTLNKHIIKKISHNIKIDNFGQIYKSLSLF